MFVRMSIWFFFFFKPKTAYELRISDWSSDVCSSDLAPTNRAPSIADARASRVCSAPAEATLVGERLPPLPAATPPRRPRMSVCPNCETDAHLRLQRQDGEPGYQCDACGTWMLFGALPPKPTPKGRAAAHKASPGRWPADMPLTEDGKVEEGLVVLSRSGEIEGRTTGDRK